MPDIKFICPHCRQSLEAPADMVGQHIECPSCKQTIEVNQSQARSAIPPTSNQGQTKACPFCGEQILASAIKCKHCGEILRKDQYNRVSQRQSGPRVGIVKNTPYYQNVFALFERQNGQFIPTWNWAAFFFGALWYLYKGMWIKALLMLLLIFIFAGVPAFFLWIYTGMVGNWDYYLLETKGKHFW